MRKLRKGEGYALWRGLVNTLNKYIKIYKGNYNSSRTLFSLILTSLFMANGTAQDLKRDLLYLKHAVSAEYKPQVNSSVQRLYPLVDLQRYPIIEFRVDTTQLGYIEVGEAIPDIILDMPLQIVNDDQGRTVTNLRELSDRKFLVLDFWARWCKPCLASMVKWEELRPHIEKDIRVVGVHIDFDYKAAVEANERGWKNTQIIGGEGYILHRYLMKKRYLGPSVWIKDGKLFGITKATTEHSEYIFDLITGRMDSIPVSARRFTTE